MIDQQPPTRRVVVSDVSLSRGVRMLSSCLRCDAEPLSLSFSLLPSSSLHFPLIKTYKNMAPGSPTRPVLENLFSRIVPRPCERPCRRYLQFKQCVWFVNNGTVECWRARPIRRNPLRMEILREYLKTTGTNVCCFEMADRAVFYNERVH